MAPAAALPGGEGAMALPWLQRVELVLFAAAFLCGAVAAAALTRTQVILQSLPRQRDKSSGVSYSTRQSPAWWLLLHNLTSVLKRRSVQALPSS